MGEKTKGGCKLLSDRERMVLHFCCTTTIAKITGIPHRDMVVENMIRDVRKERCRGLSEEEIISLLDEINEEMLAGRLMFQHIVDESKHLMDEEIWSMTGERPSKDDWSDMR